MNFFHPPTYSSASYTQPPDNPTNLTIQQPDHSIIIYGTSMEVVYFRRGFST